MTLEVSQVDHPVIVGKMISHDVVLDVATVLDGDTHLTELVHDIDGKDGIKAMLMDSLPVLGNVLTRTAISRAALHNSSTHLVHEIADECGFQVMVITGLASADFHSHTASWLHP